ncbi:hypothetical protein GGS23DRAFT_558548 [Durotheca rogersii]|uniref:uncharacterized protein n=1 Tax=Durotheca rogersii TaxID=419775 RepID=UPI00221FA613|nr:uncharacterized protein GGS23DRAFT_558548 [Durotheca rogersii]KAI5865283.1 hypothetical protein GGS23DRAFT_558548 [Durotheca rogersii]
MASNHGQTNTMSGPSTLSFGQAVSSARTRAASTSNMPAANHWRRDLRGLFLAMLNLRRANFRNDIQWWMIGAAAGHVVSIPAAKLQVVFNCTNLATRFLRARGDIVWLQELEYARIFMRGVEYIEQLLRAVSRILKYENRAIASTTSNERQLPRMQRTTLCRPHPYPALQSHTHGYKLKTYPKGVKREGIYKIKTGMKGRLLRTT